MNILTFIKRSLTIVVMVLSVQYAVAQSATSILDKTAAKFKAAGGVKATFTMDAGAGPASGVIKLSGKKFTIDIGGGYVVWFDGKDMWSYLKDNEEVNITNPTPEETARMNPYAFVDLYKKGYDAKMGKSTAQYYEVILNATDKKLPLQKVVLHINKSNYQPVMIDMTSSKTTSKITITSYNANQKFSSSTFTFNKKSYPNVEIIDLR